MIHKLYSIRDSKSEHFLQPILQKTHGEAERTFKDLANNKETTVSRNPEDYDLYYLGEFNDITGKYESLDTPQHIIKAVQLITQ